MPFQHSFCEVFRRLQQYLPGDFDGEDVWSHCGWILPGKCSNDQWQLPPQHAFVCLCNMYVFLWKRHWRSYQVTCLESKNQKTSRRFRLRDGRIWTSSRRSICPQDPTAIWCMCTLHNIVYMVCWFMTISFHFNPCHNSSQFLWSRCHRKNMNIKNNLAGSKAKQRDLVRFHSHRLLPASAASFYCWWCWVLSHQV